MGEEPKGEEAARGASPQPGPDPHAPRTFSPEARRWGWILAVVGVVALVAGGLLVQTCSSIVIAPGCSQETEGPCTLTGACPALSGLGVVLVAVGFIVLAVGIALVIGRAREGDVPHPEKRSRKAPKETAMTRMEREREEARQKRQELG